MASTELTTMTRGLTRLEDSLFAPDKSEHYENLAIKLSSCQVVPKQYIGKPTDLFVAMAMGYQLGMPVEQAIQDIAVINGRPCVWGDGLLAIVMNHPEFDDIIEEPIMKGDTVTGYSCTVKRRNKSDYTKTFTLDMAKKAGLLGKPGPWSQYTERMLQMRARGFALRDRFPDALRGIKLREEVEDYIDGEVVAEKTANGLSRTEQLKHDIKQRQGATSEQDNSANEIPANQDNHLAPTENAEANQHDESSHGAGGDDTSVQHRPVDTSPATVEQIDLISSLMSEKEFDQERMEKAFIYFEITDLEQLTKDKAKRFIKMLGK